MKKGQVYEGMIQKVEFPNKGIVQVDGEEKPVIVKNGIPGQKIRFCVNKLRKGKAEGRLLEVMEKSALETREPVCSIFPACGGCMYQTMDYQAQVKMKAEQIQSIMDAAVDGYSYTFEGVKESPKEFAYRNKMEFSFGDEYKDGPLSLGLHKKGSTYDVLTASDCKLVHEDMTQILSCVLDYFKERGVSYYKKMQHIGYLRHLLLRRGDTTGEILVNLVTTTQEEHDLAPLVEKLLALPVEGKIVGILHILNDSLSDVVQSDETKILYGQDYFYEKIMGLEFKITPFSFFQPNSRGAEVLYSTVREYIGDIHDMTVYDLFSGTGTIAQVLAPVAKQVIGVEIIEEAVEAAKENAERNGLHNCRFIAGDVFKVLDEIEEKPDVIVLDPPRDGIHPKALPKILDYGVENIVYISCKATSLARDLEMIQARGYRVVKCTAVDQFCQTVHVETVVLLSQQKPDDRIEVEIELDELDLTSAESKATYKEIQEYVLEKYGLKVSNLYISQVKRKCGIEVGMNYNLPKSEDSRQPQCPEEKEKAIKDALEHFGMV
ncbi:MAG: 23S rRNA (uracil(1939)-C(5))-methyltransferase RlmD [Faecalimonas umbilicata]|uniref:23S rRNA (uracil(1939)-C(5))-methyltransferase RlmD n=1 Tax=Faecalimonas umbilicata TaxID=1912855 RepID=UPI00242B6A92|nr:23S rRNA (uracil(1939)-C(5))-methyltransferase RlmD [Faecalimonas umbilicata]MCI5985653.1 23S rRNA (uracil(1939)-C(5))-methyltransferase RlmD [Faecalimonas umbilicata]